jgi:hypothetical protein
MPDEDEGISLRDANYGPVTLGSTEGRMIAVENPLGAAFIYTDDQGALCVMPWGEAIKRFGPVKHSG